MWATLITTLVLGQSSVLLNSAQPPQLEVLSSPLTSEQSAVYHLFFIDYRQGSSPGDSINVADVTETLQPDDGDYSGCMKDFRRDPPTRIVHRLAEDFAKENNLQLVDLKLHKVQDPADSMMNGLSVESAVKSGFKSGVLTISEIIFDTKHKRAAFHYSFVCGKLCAHFETVVYEKRQDRWQRSKLSCGYGIS